MIFINIGNGTRCCLMILCIAFSKKLDTQTYEQFKKTVLRQWKMFNGNSEANLLHIIFRSLSKCSEELEHTIDQNQSKPCKVRLSETLISSNQPFEQFVLNDYKLIVPNSSNKCNGFAVHIHQNTSFEIFEQATSILSNLTTVCFNEQTILKYCVYKSPRNSNRVFLLQFHEYFEHWHKLNCINIMDGDLNN